MTPHLDLVRHAAPEDRGPPVGADARRARELTALRARWGGVLLADPAYSPLLALSEPPHTALACPPRACDPRRRGVGAPAALPMGL